VSASDVRLACHVINRVQIPRINALQSSSVMMRGSFGAKRRLSLSTRGTMH